MVTIKKKKRKDDLTDPLRPEPRKDVITEPKRFNVGGVQVSEEEFKKASRELRSQAEGERIIQAGGIGPEEITARKTRREIGTSAVPQILEEAGAFEEVTPRVSDLRPSESVVGKIPLVGKSIEAIGAALSQSTFLKPFKGEKGVTGETAFPVVDDETIREAALRQIRQDSFNKGITSAEAFGAFVESIPVVGNRARAWADGLIEDPSPNAEEVINHINRIREDASTGQEKVRNGLEDPDFGLDNARRMESEIAELEGRLKLLLETSPVLKSNFDKIGTLQEQVFEAKEKVSRYRIASTFGLTAQLTGTGRIIPTDEQLFFELKESRKRK